MELIIWFVDAVIILILINLALGVLSLLYSNKLAGILTTIVLGYIIVHYLFGVFN